MTKLEACRRWVDSFNAAPTQMLMDLWAAYPEKVQEVTTGDFEHDDLFPAWGYMWSFGSNADDYWLTDMDGIKTCSDIGFRVYESDYGYYLGIDGAGFDFYEAFWLPLYEARGLKWHDCD